MKTMGNLEMDRKVIYGIVRKKCISVSSQRKWDPAELKGTIRKSRNEVKYPEKEGSALLTFQTSENLQNGDGKRGLHKDWKEQHAPK